MHLVFSANFDSVRIIDYSKHYIYSPQILPQAKSFDWIIFISPVSVILIFILSQWIAENNRKKELHRNWYFKAHLESSINKFEELLIESSKLVKDYYRELNFTNRTFEEDIVLKAKTLDGLKDLIRRFEFEVIQPLKILYPNIFNSSINELNIFQDLFTNLFDKEIELINFLNEWSEIKGKIRASLLAILSKPVITLQKKLF